VAALALTGQEAQAREALQRYLALPSTGPLKTIAAWKAYFSAQGGDPPRVELNERVYDGLRKAGCRRREERGLRCRRAALVMQAVRQVCRAPSPYCGEVACRLHPPVRTHARRPYALRAKS
jgi:hypothetical protein